jgi:hypothetical protein
MFLNKMTTPKDVKSHFHLNPHDYDGEVFIQVMAKNPEVRRRLMDGICMENYGGSFQYVASPEYPNTVTLGRRIFVSVFPKLNTI